MTPQLINHLCKYDDSHITIAANILEDAQRLAKMHPDKMSAVYLDISDEKALSALVESHTHVISFIPPFLHHHVAKACVEHGRNVTTSSYTSPAVRDMQDEVKAKGLIFLNECGLDPGIDILGTMKVVHEAEKKGQIVKKYASYCGGLPVAEQADDNPLAYKFSWNPGAGIAASRNAATFRKDGKVVTAPNCLKASEVRDDFSQAMKLVIYPNRDSLIFQEAFGMKDCDTFVRGTIRFRGFCGTVAAFHDLGLTSDKPVPADVKTLR